MKKIIRLALIQSGEAVVELGDRKTEASRIDANQSLPNNMPLSTFVYEATLNNGLVFTIPGDKVVAVWEEGRAIDNDN